MSRRTRAGPSTAVCIEKRRLKRGRISYRLKWRDASGNVQRLSCGADHKLAGAMKIEKQAELRRGLLGDLPVTELGEFIEMMDTLMAGKAHDSIEKNKVALRQVQELCGVRLLSDLDRKTVMEFKAKRLKVGLAPATVGRDLRQLKSALSYAVDAGLLRENFMLRWRNLFPKVPEKMARIVEIEELRKLRPHVRFESFWVLILVAYHQGLRRTELCNLRWHGPQGQPVVDFNNGLIYVVNRWDMKEFTKSRKNRVLPLHEEAQEAMSKLWASVPKLVKDGRVCSKHDHVFCQPEAPKLTGRWVTNEFQQAVLRAGLPHFTLHDLRRTWATNLLNAGVDKYTVKDLGGWSDVKVIEGFYQGDISAWNVAAMRRVISVG